MALVQISSHLWYLIPTNNMIVSKWASQSTKDSITVCCLHARPWGWGHQTAKSSDIRWGTLKAGHSLHFISTVRRDITFSAEPPSPCWSHPLVYQAQEKESRLCIASLTEAPHSPFSEDIFTGYHLPVFCFGWWCQISISSVMEAFMPAEHGKKSWTDSSLLTQWEPPND